VRKAVIAVTAALVFAGAAAAASGGPSQSLGPARNHDCRVHGALPDHGCTPGAIFTGATKVRVCTPGYSGSVRSVSESLKRAVYSEYGIFHHVPYTYEIDHLVPLELGGSNDESNLWPEAAAPRPGYHEKDRLENQLHELVCSGRMGLGAAQRDIAQNWLAENHQLGG
jgi:hypothetical protein